jgi:hypothetical protein
VTPARSLPAEPVDWFRSGRFAAFLLAAFAFRFLFGLVCPPILIAEDETQIYTIGLKSYTTHTWPFFGPDVVGFGASKIQIPGALQGLVVALPLEVWPIPEAPYLFLNLLSLAAFTFLGWYVLRRLPGLSPWFVFTWLFVAPWSLHYTTQVINPSYAVLGSILFFVGFLDSLPAFSPSVLPRPVANALMGFGLLWTAQLHMSWVLLVPFAGLSLLLQWREGHRTRPLGGFLVGALPLLALLAPTYLRYGFTSGSDAQRIVSSVDWKHVCALFDIAAKFLSFASFEMPRFIGLPGRPHFAYLLDHWPLLLPGVFLLAVGIAQPLAMVYLGATKRTARRDWNALRWVTTSCVLLIWVSFWFTAKDPRAHTFYIILPLAFVFSFYCWDFLSSSARWRRFARVFLAAAILFQTLYGYYSYRSGTSGYLESRAKISRALSAGDYRMLEERRRGSRY